MFNFNRKENILVINCGSSSIKYALYEMYEQKLLAKGLIERIGQSGCKLKHSANGKTKQQEISISSHRQGIWLILKTIVDKEFAGISKLSKIDAVGHRVVHGGEALRHSVIINEHVIKTIEGLFDLAPLHNPPDVEGIKAAKEILQDVPHIAFFDTAFHRTVPEEAYMYALPFELYEKYGIRKYGFHGISHNFASDRASQILNDQNLNLIVCHLGNGCSITAVKNGKSVDTSMGFTPMEGLMMGTRPGDFDPSIIFYLESKGYDRDQLNDICNKQSGLLGISGISNDIRDLIEAAKNGNHRAQLAMDMFCYRVKKYIGSYIAVLGSLDAIVFTGGIGENTPSVREQICRGLQGLGIEIDSDKNNSKQIEKDISSPASNVRLLVIAANEELAIATECFKIIRPELAVTK